MKTLLLLAAVSAAPVLPGESSWAYVPASADSHSLATIAIPAAPTEADVRLVGESSASMAPPAAPRPVVAADIAPEPPAPPAGRARVGPVDDSMPEGACWPDSGGRIVAVLPAPGTTPAEATIRNPWTVRVHSRPAGSETVFACGGVVMGGAGGPIAFVNGHMVRLGDSLGRFRVARIGGAGVVLARDGLLLVLPMGRTTAVTTVGG